MKEVKDQRWLLLSIKVNCPDAATGDFPFILTQVKWNSQERYFPVGWRNVVVSTKSSNSWIIRFQDTPKSESTDFLLFPLTKGEHRHCRTPSAAPLGLAAWCRVSSDTRPRCGLEGESWESAAASTGDSITCPWPSPEVHPSDAQWCGRQANSTHTKITFVHTLNIAEVLFLQCECKAQCTTSVTWTMTTILT